MNTEYENLDLDRILELARSDAEHAGDMAEQARVLRQMSGDLQEKVDLMRGVMTTLFGGDEAPETGAWGGESSKMMKTELNRLFTMADKAPSVLNDNATTMDDFSTKVHGTLVTIDQLHVTANPDGGEGSNLRQARDTLQSATTGYLSTANGMPEPEFYNGLRESADEQPSGDWTADHGAAHAPAGPPGPAPNAPATPGPALQGPAPGPTAPPPPGPAPVTPGPAPVAPGPAPVPPGPAPVPPFGGPPPAPRGPSVPPSALQPRPGAFPQPRPANTVSPVIGPRRPQAMPAPAIKTPTPNPGGTVRPVIGARPGTSTMPVASRPAASGPGGTVRPVIGARPGTSTMPVASRPAASGPGGTVRPVIGSRPVSIGKATTTAPPARGGPAPSRTGGSAFIPARFHTARPAGGLALGAAPTPARPAPNRVPTAPAPSSGEPTQRNSRPPGQRVPRVPPQGGPAVERAIVRGYRQPRRRSGQEVFAAFDKAKADNDRAAESTSDVSDEAWEIRRVTVPAVITPRKAD